MSYDKPTISGYNQNPPPDNGTTGSDNEITWAKHKAKLADPIKTLVDAVNQESFDAWADLASTATDDGTKGFHLVSYPPLSGETGVVNYEYHWEEADRFDVAGDGTTDDHSEIQNGIDSTPRLKFKNNPHLVNTNAVGILITADDKTLSGDFKASLKTTAAEYVTVTFGDLTSDRPTNQNLIGMVGENGTGNTNNYPVFRYGGVEASVLAFNHVKAAFYGFGIQYTRNPHASNGERRTSQLRSVGNLSETSGAGFEHFSNLNSAVIGNIAHKAGAKASDHGFRVTGYGTDETINSQGSDLRNYGNAFAGNAVQNYTNGLSQQVGVFANAYAGFALIGVTTGLQFIVNNSTVLGQSRNNTLSSFTIDDCTSGMSLEKTERHIFDAFSISNFASRGISHLVATSASTYGTGKYNRFSGIISEQDAGATENAAHFEGSNTRIDLTLADITAPNGCVVSGNYNIITLIGGEMDHASSALLRVSGNNNIVQVAGDGFTNATTVRIEGDNNTVTLGLKTSSTPGYLLISGTGNIARGKCKLSTIAAGNDVTGVLNATTRGTLSGTTDGSGDITVTHGLIGGNASFIATAISTASTFQSLNIHTLTSTTFKVRFFDAAGAAITSTSVGAHWRAEQDYG